MSTVTPILDTLLPQVLGRAGDLVRLGRRDSHALLSMLRADDNVLSARDNASARAGGQPLPRTATRQPAVREAIARDAGAATPAQRGAPPTGAQPVAADASAELHFSRAGRALLQLLRQAGSAPHDADTRPGGASGRVLAANLLALTPARLAVTLQNQVTQSGLFYESHLAEWVRGERPQAALQAEPQARLAAQGGNAAASAGAGTATAADGPAPAAAQAAQTQAPTDVQMAGIVRQQVELLATGVFQWHGQAWADVPMRWSIEREQPDPEPPEPADRDDGGAEQERRHGPVSTSLALDLPGLGVFEARLRLDGDHVSVAAWVAPGVGRSLLAADVQTLRRRLRQAGFVDPVVQLLQEPAQ